ncbi:MAG TPA: PIN domain-containing protein [Candidatus Dormibacteraeota bacterium]|nr:PIN domain-containing protein [Candidatus Dormibacteraeota bacterium]
MALICDTGPLYAALDRSDADHSACAALLAEARDPIVVPAPVVVELEWLASSKLDPRAFLAFLADVEADRIKVAELERLDYIRIGQLTERYIDLPLGFVDAAVLAVLERFGERRLATLDHRHFSVVRPRHVASLELLP